MEDWTHLAAIPFTATGFSRRFLADCPRRRPWRGNIVNHRFAASNHIEPALRSSGLSEPLATLRGQPPYSPKCVSVRFSTILLTSTHGRWPMANGHWLHHARHLVPEARDVSPTLASEPDHLARVMAHMLPVGGHEYLRLDSTALHRLFPEHRRGQTSTFAPLSLVISQRLTLLHSPARPRGQPSDDMSGPGRACPIRATTNHPSDAPPGTSPGKPAQPTVLSTGPQGEVKPSPAHLRRHYVQLSWAPDKLALQTLRAPIPQRCGRRAGSSDSRYAFLETSS